MTTYKAESFYRGKITTSITASATCPITVRVSKLPNLSNGLVTISPNTEYEEIFEYNNPNATDMTVDLVKRGIKPSSTLLTTNGTDYNNTAYQKDHTQNDIIRGDVNHIHINQGIGNTTLATNTGVGISKLSVAAVDVNNPIVVGDNDPRLGSRVNAGYLALTTSNTTTIPITVGFQPKLIRITASTNTFGSFSDSTSYYNGSAVTTYARYTTHNQTTGYESGAKLDILPAYPVTLRNYDGTTTQTMTIQTLTVQSNGFTLSAPNWSGVTTCNLYWEAIA